MINNLYEIIKKQGIEIKELKNKIVILDERIKKLEEISNNKKENNKLFGDIITKKEQIEQICNWINKTKSLNFKLLYKGTRDGDSYEQFHKICDNQGTTILIIKSKNGQIFGGYTTKSFDKNNKSLILDNKSFLFNINANKKYSASSQGGIRNFERIISFGGNYFHEFSIILNFLSKSSSWYKSNGYNLNSDLIGGYNEFLIDELEVYKIEEY